MTDLERTIELLTSMKIDFFFDDRDWAQGTEHSYCKIIVPTLNSINAQAWFFYSIPNPNRDPKAKVGNFVSIESWELKEKYWPDDFYDSEENEHLLFGKAPVILKW